MDTNNLKAKFYTGVSWNWTQTYFKRTLWCSDQTDIPMPMSIAWPTSLNCCVMIPRRCYKAPKKRQRVLLCEEKQHVIAQCPKSFAINLKIMYSMLGSWNKIHTCCMYLYLRLSTYSIQKEVTDSLRYRSSRNAFLCLYFSLNIFIFPPSCKILDIVSKFLSPANKTHLCKEI